MAFHKRKARAPDGILAAGWQFYHWPTTLEPIGTVFRIDREQRRIIVDELAITSRRGRESSARVEHALEAGAGIIARLIGLELLRGGARAARTETVVFELAEPEREYTTDAEVDRVLGPYLAELAYRADNRYFLIRDCRWAAAMTYRLAKERLVELGGEAAVTAALAAEAKLTAVGGDLYEIDRTFPEPMRVMFLPEEIKPVAAGLGGGEPELGRVPVTEPLLWID